MEIALAIIQIFKDAVATILIIFLVWLVLAVLTIQIEEWIASLYKWRATMLEDTITTMLGEHVKDRFYNHPLIRGLYTDKGRIKPGGIPQDKFALVLLGEVMKTSIKATYAENTGTVAENSVIVIKDANINNNVENTLAVVENTITDVETTFRRLKKSITDVKSSSREHELTSFVDTLDTLLIGIEERADDATYAFTEAQRRVESWFDDAMERLGSSYRRRVQYSVMIIGITLATIFNVDTAAIANTLWKDSVTKQAIATQASQLKEPGSNTPASTDAIIAYINQSEGLSLPIGWSSKSIPVDTNGWMTKTAGILFSGLMAAQGAPYWFDFMRKLLSRQVVIGQPQT
jgi:hypothetical protein